MLFLLYIIFLLSFPFLCAWVFSVLKIRWQIMGYLITFLWAAVIYPTLFFGFVGLFTSDCGNIAGGFMLVNFMLGVPFTLLFQALAFARFPIELKKQPN